MSRKFYDTTEGVKVALQSILSRVNNLDDYNTNHLFNERVLHEIEYEMKVIKRNLSYLQSSVDKEIWKAEEKEGE